MAQIIKACIDRKRLPKTRNERMALVTNSMWKGGDGIRVAFMGGDATVQARVEHYAKMWLQFANLKLYFGSDPNADIRIAFNPGGSWSYIGTDCRAIPKDKPTMNYGWLTPESSDSEVSRVVLHEFGHALGCIHEHQNPAAAIKWKKDDVYRYYAGDPNYWSKEEVDSNLFETYDKELTVHTALDANSIMMYPIPAEFTEDGFSVGLNITLSENDKEFIRNKTQ
jgi:hypothetical protein